MLENTIKSHKSNRLDPKKWPVLIYGTLLYLQDYLWMKCCTSSSTINQNRETKSEEATPRTKTLMRGLGTRPSCRIRLWLNCSTLLVLHHRFRSRLLCSCLTRLRLKTGTIIRLTWRPRGSNHIQISIQLRVTDVKSLVNLLGLESF